MIDSLQTLRGMCAVMILAHHFGFNSSVTTAFGDSCVTLFMMLSGFVLTWGHLGKTTTFPFLSFIRRRLNRVYPLYLAGLGAALVLDRSIFAGALAACILMVQSWIPEASYFFAGNAPGWFVSSLMFGYLLFPLILNRCLASGIRKRAFRLGVVSCAVVLTCIAATFAIPEDDVLAWIYIFPPMQMPSFIIGMFLAALLYECRGQFSRRSVTFLTVISMALFGGLWPVHHYVPERWALCAMWWLPSALLIFSFTLVNGFGNPLSRLLKWRFLVWLGNISYAFYIFHVPCMHAFRRCWGGIGLQPLPLGTQFIIILTLTAIGAAIATPLFNHLTRYLDRLKMPRFLQ